MYIEPISKIVRWYLRNIPITEGKKQLLALTKPCLMPNNKLSVVNMNYDFVMQLNLHNEEHARMWLYGEHDERYEISLLRKILQPGDVAWDIGANIGYYSCLFAKLVGETGKVYSFEPAKSTYEFLKDQIQLNNFTNITPLRLGLGSKIESVPLYYNQPGAGEGTASIKYTAGKSNQEDIQIETIDHLCSQQRIEIPDFVKIDVEGFQQEVFEGAQGFLAKHSPMILAELQDENKEEIHALEKMIREQGYSLYEIHKRHLLPCLNVAHSKKRNFLLAKKRALHHNRIATYIK